ncbi:MAG: hypothetical protein HZC13_07525 [Nitrospirae bacterium]|nr:hypothetical protein [Nitrospirota bacterium]
MGAPKDGQGFAPRRTSRTLRLKSAVLTPQMGVFERHLIKKGKVYV